MMQEPRDSWLIEGDADAYANGFSAVLNEDAPALNQPLFHYTSEAGLDGILRTGELWATSISYMDDPSELKLSWKLSSEITSQWSGRSWDFDRIVRAIPKWFDDLNRERFIVSFCSEPDYLLAWRAYAADSHGYCLELSPDSVRGTDGWYLARIEYSEEEFRQELHRILTRIERAFLSVQKTPHIQFLYQQTSMTAAMWLSLVAPTFKDVRYESEKEWRMIRMQFAEDSELPLNVQYRLRGGERVPYVARSLINPGATEHGLLRILCGARVSDSAVANVRLLAEQRFPGCEVVRSALGFRRPG